MPDDCEVGIVVIGRNEGDRLVAALTAAMPWRARLVYVDSNSYDGSADRAEAMGVDVVRLSEGRLSAARGRRVGLEFLSQTTAELQFVQFVDGDCTLHPEWIGHALERMKADPHLGAVAGHLREHHQDDSLLLRVVAVDWDLPIGRVDVVGGISMMRLSALREAGGWNDDLIAGEELDLSIRIQAAGYSLERINCEMCRHDMGVTHLGEFWRRSVRTGFSYAQLAWLHRRTGPKRWVRRTIGAIAYGLLLPFAVAFGWLWHWGVSVAAACLMVLLFGRLLIWRLRRADSIGIAVAYAAIVTACKTAQAMGAMKFLTGRLLGRTQGIIEYKRSSRAKVT